MKRSLIVLLLALAPGALLADTVLLKDGRRFENVRATLGRDALIIQTEDGRRLTFSPDELKELRYAPVRAAPAARERERVREKELEQLRTENAQLRAERERRSTAEARLAETERETEALRGELQAARANPEKPEKPEKPETPENPPGRACGFGRPWLEGWLPFWSPHYCAGRYKTGILFTALETTLLYNALLWAPTPRKRGEDGLYQLAGVVSALRVSSGAGEGALFWLYWNQAGEETYYHPRSRRGFIQADDFNRERRFAVFALLLTLFLDGATTAYLNDATPTPTPTPTPTAALRAGDALAPAITAYPVHDSAGDDGLAVELTWHF